MELSLIILSILLFVLVCFLGILAYFLYGMLKVNSEMQEQMEVYEDFLSQVTGVLEDDVDFLRSSLVQKLSLDIPEVQELNHGLAKFRDDVTRVKQNLRKFKISTSSNE